jgi:ABC-type branched-chain amino acid transport systems, periplasmic component
MKNMKKIIALMTAVVLSMAVITACGNGNDQGSSTDTSTSADTSTDAGDDVFLIGGIGPITGPAASYGISVKQGAEIAIQEINDAGGVTVGGKTYTFALEFADDEASEEKAPQAYNSLMDKGINVLLGAVTSGASISIADHTYADGILQITPSASAPGAIINDNAFRTCFSDPEQGIAMAANIVEELGHKKVAVIYNAADEYSTGIREEFEAEVEALGGEIVASEAFNTDDVDFNTQLTTIRGTDAEAIYVPAYYQDATFITKQAADMGLDLPFFGSDGWDGILGTVTDKATVEGVIFSSPFCAAVDEANVVDFVNAYEAAYNAIPDQFAAGAYDTVYSFKAAMEEAGSIESADLIAAMLNISVSGLTGDAISFDASGAVVKEVKFVTVQDGEYAYVD